MVDFLDMQMSIADIATRLGISAETVRRHYAKEIAATDPIRGPKPFEPTSQQRQLVKAAVAYGMTLSEIAALIGPDGITESRLTKVFKEELAVGSAQASFKVATALFKMATGWSGTPTRVNADAAKFWAERRMGWKSQTSVELNLKKDASEYTDDELAAAIVGGRQGAADAEDGA